METSPGGYGIKPVSDALDTLPIGKLSGVIEGPDGFHIIKVEKRRPAGPASFEEVQNEIRPILENQKFAAERNALLAKLRKNTLIVYYDMNPRKKPTKLQSVAN
jgi:parvulin-like peptidyl-prolyl isomerase